MQLADSAPSALDVRLFGSVQVQVQGQPLPPLRSRKGQYLLALLILRHDRPVERDWLAGTLWPESAEGQALYNLRQCLSNLRQALGGHAHRLLSPAPHTLSLDLNGVTVDVVEFDQAIVRGDEASLQRAVGLYEGPLLEGCTEEWVMPERQAREQAYLNALETLAERSLQAGEPQTAVGYLRQVIGVDPLRESAQRGLLQALAASGDYAAAVLSYRELRLLLRRELNAQPDPQTTALFEQLRQQAHQQAQNRPRDLPAPASSISLAPRSEPLADLASPVSSTVTLLFTDIVGSTQLWEAHPEPMRVALARHDALLHQAISAHQGQVFKTVGDAFCAVFPTAANALSAAVVAQLALQELYSRGGEGEKGGEGESSDFPLCPFPFSLEVRMALHSGAVEERDGDYFGPTVNRVARLLSVGQGGQILLSAATHELLGGSLPEEVALRDLGRHRLSGVEQPLQMYAVVHPHLPQECAPLSTLDALPNNLPEQMTSFIGREREIEEVQHLLSRRRLLTLTGAGGCGKTRLALQVAEAVRADYPDGVWLVELASLSDPALLPQSVASILGLREEPARPLQQSLVEYLKSRQVLLLLDNCEHLVAACARLADTLLRACPNLKMLATSREVLQVAAEYPWRVPPMAHPVTEPLPIHEKEFADSLLEYDACRLFVERARLQQPEFTLTASNALALTQLCRHLDGMPLALELAAARMRVLSIEQVCARLQDRFSLLRGGSRTAAPRHQTLRALIDWSYDLLEPEEQLLLRRVSVFAGGFSLEAAECVCTSKEEEEPIHPSSFLLPPSEVLDLLTSLIDKSLVMVERREGKAEGRYRLLETIRQYGQERLAESKEGVALRDRHLDYFLTLAEEAEPQLRGPEQATWLRRLEAEHDNLRSALEWCLKAGKRGREKGEREEEQAEQPKIQNLKSKIAEVGLQLAGALELFWVVRGYFSEGRTYLAEALRQEGAAERTQERAKALHAAGYLAERQSDFEAARTLHEESLTIRQELGDKQGIASSLNTLGIVAHDQGDYEAARALYEQSLSIRREIGDKLGIASTLHNLAALLSWHQGDYAAAKTMMEESLSIRRELGDMLGIAISLHGLGEVAAHQGDYKAARALYEQSLSIQRELGEKRNFAISLMHLGIVAKEQGNYEAAKILYEQSLVLFRELGEKGFIPWSHFWLGEIAVEQGDYKAARTLLEESLAAERELGDKPGIAIALLHLGRLAYRENDYAACRSYLEECLTILKAIGLKRLQALALEHSALLARHQNQAERAVRLWGAAEALRDAIGCPLPPDQRKEYNRNLAAVREALGEEAFASAWIAGRAMPWEQAVDYALEPPTNRPPAAEGAE